MFSLKGILINCFQVPAGKNNDGESYEESFKLQITGSTIDKNGETRMAMHDVKVPREVYLENKSKQGKEISLPVGIFGKVQPFYAGIVKA